MGTEGSSDKAGWVWAECPDDYQVFGCGMRNNYLHFDPKSGFEVCALSATNALATWVSALVESLCMPAAVRSTVHLQRFRRHRRHRHLVWRTLTTSSASTGEGG